MITKRKTFLQINDDDNLLVALQNLKKGTEIIHNGNRIILQDDIDAKHKFTTEAIPNYSITCDVYVILKIITIYLSEFIATLQ